MEVHVRSACSPSDYPGAIVSSQVTVEREGDWTSLRRYRVQYVCPFASHLPHTYDISAHCLLYDVPRILHRDLSLNNIMCPIIEKMSAKGKTRKVYGVLTGCDLSSWKKELKPDYTRTPRQRTGTPPYMTHGLLKGTLTRTGTTSSRFSTSCC